MKDNVESSVTPDILRYLKQKKSLNFAEEGEELQLTDSGLDRPQNILRDLADDVADRAHLIEDFETRLRDHNQYPLFDLRSTIPNFCIDDNLYQKLAFRENLSICYINSVTGGRAIVGGLCLDVQLAKGKNPLERQNKILEYEFVNLFKENDEVPKYEISNTLLGKTDSKQEAAKFKTALRSPYQDSSFRKFLVHVSSKFDCKGNHAGSRITTWLDRNFHTLEEKRNEYIFEEGNILNEQSLYCALQPRRYYLKIENKKAKICERKYYSMEKTKDLICEGANFVLMRYLAITKYIGTFELSTMNINGAMCRNIYESLGPESDVINNVKLDVCKIYRTVIEECKIMHKSVTVLTLTGQLLKRQCDDSDYVLRINPAAYVSNEKLNTHNKLMLSKTWEKDIQLFSKHLDCQTTVCMELKSYVADHSEFKNIISDYVQATLLMKPEEILSFTIKYFKKYYPS